MNRSLLRSTAPRLSEATRCLRGLGIALLLASGSCTDPDPSLPDAALDAGTAADGGGPTADASSLDAGSRTDTGPLRDPCTEPYDDFYAFPTDLPPSDGDLIRCEPLADGVGPTGYHGFRVMYRTSTELHEAGETTEVSGPATGVVFVPDAPDDVPLVLANTHGTTGVISSCAPSFSGAYDGTLARSLAPLLGRPVVVVPDYVGLGVDPGLRAPDSDASVSYLGVRYDPLRRISHPYLSLTSEGRATVDLVRAARQLPQSHLGDTVDWFVSGQSQGGHAAIATAAVVQQGYGGADLHLLGVVAGAPASQLIETTYTQPEVLDALLPMILAGASLEWRDVRSSELLTDPAQAALASTSGASCLDGSSLGTWVTAYATLLATGSRLLRVDLHTDLALVEAMTANDPNKRVSVPIFVGQVEGDPVVDSRRTDAFVESLRATNPELVTYCRYEGRNLGAAWYDRAENHDAFRAMFTPDAPGVCSGPDGTPADTNALDFVRNIVSASR